MSTPKPEQDRSASKLYYLTENHIQQAVWLLGGAFRYDRTLLKFLEFNRDYLPTVYRIRGVAGSLPCAWSLDWFEQRRPMNLAKCLHLIDLYGGVFQRGVNFVFDNPWITDEQLQDPYAIKLVEELAARNKHGLNGVYVANDKLAMLIHKIAPKLPISCHYNRTLTEQTRRTADFYNKLAARYSTVAMHPADATKPQIYTKLEKPGFFEIVMNDPCLRLCPLRKEHMRLLSEMRRNAYDVTLQARLKDMLDRTACQHVNPAALLQKASCNLTKAETDTLYNAGFRHFIIQGNQFRNELTYMWDLLRCMLPQTPELTNKSAAIASAFATTFGKPEERLCSGLRLFQFSNYEQ